MIDGSPGTRERGEEERQANLIWLFGQMMMIPLATFVYGMEMLVKSMRQMQTVANQGMYAMAAEGPALEISAGERKFADAHPASVPSDNAIDSTDTNLKELKSMADITYDRNLDRANLSDDNVKLVRYKVLFVKRNLEVAFREREDLVWNNLKGTDFIAWKTAEFIQDLGKEDVPKRWIANGYPRPGVKAGDKIDSLDEDDKKYLRVFYEVLDRYPRDPGQYEDDQIMYLARIEKAIEKGSAAIEKGFGKP